MLTIKNQRQNWKKVTSSKLLLLGIEKGKPSLVLRSIRKTGKAGIRKKTEETALVELKCIGLTRGSIL